jgi:hypothetical protein
MVPTPQGRRTGGRQTGPRRRIDHGPFFAAVLEHYSHIRLNAKKAALDRLKESAKTSPIKITK